jgi:cell pole-organizing protein PopZ
MAEAAKTQDRSMEDLRARIRRIIADDDVKPAERQMDSTSSASDTAAAPPPTRALNSAMPSPCGAERIDPNPSGSSDNQVSATAISDCSSALLNAAAAIASPKPQSAGIPSDPTLLSTPLSRLDAGDSDSALRCGHASSQVPVSSPVLEPAFSGNEPQESGFGRAGEQVTMSTSMPYAPRDRDESRFGHTGQQSAMSSHGPQFASALDKEDCQQLISPEINNVVLSAFDALAQTVLLHNARTLEDMVREMLRPILKVWLDDNLPTLVERLVRAEIERVQRPAHGKLGDR